MVEFTNILGLIVWHEVLLAGSHEVLASGMVLVGFLAVLLLIEVQLALNLMFFEMFLKCSLLVVTAVNNDFFIVFVVNFGLGFGVYI